MPAVTVTTVRGATALLIMLAVIATHYMMTESPRSGGAEDVLVSTDESPFHELEETPAVSTLETVAPKSTTTMRKDFKNRAQPVPMEMWSKLDNSDCYTHEKGEGPDLKRWQRRAPYALIIGAMKGGTTTLNTFIKEHSLVVKTKRKELHFYDFSFDPFASKDKGILRRSARKAYGQLYRKFGFVDRLITTPNSISIDDSPRYLFWSDRIPARVVCVTPWVKILAILRNPIDRAFSQYNMFSNKKHVEISFHDWVEQDIFNDLKTTGVIQNTIPQSQFSGSPQEAAAWKAYTRLGTHAPIGRGLYAIQLRHWFKAFEDAGLTRDSFMIIQSELMKENPDLVYKDVIGFLGLPDEPLVDESPKLKGHYHTIIMPETRHMLETFFAPYNSELYKLLGGDWAGAWDP